jgi:hypothetical protein
MGKTVPLTNEDAARRFDLAALEDPTVPNLSGKGIIIAAGGPFVPSAYVVVRLLRNLGTTLPIEIWHAGEDEIPSWARRAIEPWGVTLHDVMPFCPARTQSEMRGWPIKAAALKNSKLREVLFLDADCFPLRNPEFLFESAEYLSHGSLFWPDNKHYKMTKDGTIWELTGLQFLGDVEFETGIMLIDKGRCWKELSLAQWMNEHSAFWYDHVMGDKDTFYLAWRKLGTSYFLGPPCKRYNAVITRHYWIDGQPLVDHRTGTSKYSLPKRTWMMKSYLLPYKNRPQHKNIYDEFMQRFMVRDFRLHASFLEDLSKAKDSF